MEERHWIHAIQKGDKKYLQDIAEKYYDDIFRFCAFQTGSREEAYDLTQETFLRFIRYVEGYRDRNLKGYLLTIAMNVCRNYLKEKGRESKRSFFGSRSMNEELGREGELQPAAEDLCEWKQELSEQSCPERQVIEADVHHRLMQALAQLPEIQREAILLHYLYELKYREIGTMTGVSVSTVKSRVKQGVEKLQNLLRREDFLD
nr:RNA polymerase sigma factor [uncultured Acetatifactor sp.]